MEDKKLDKALIELCSTFNKFGVRYVVVGGLARMTFLVAAGFSLRNE